MIEQELHPDPDAEKRALNELISRFSADRDGLTETIEQCRARLEELGERLEAVSVAPPASAAGEGAPDAWHAEVDRVSAFAERSAETLTALQRRLEAGLQEAAAGRAALARDLERVSDRLEDTRARSEAGAGEFRRALGSLEHRVEAVIAPGSVDPDETPWAEDVTKVRAEIIELREASGRAVGEAQARLGVRVESIVAGVEAQVSRVQDDLWQRLTDLQGRLEAQAGTLGRLRDELYDAHRAVDELEAALAEQARRGLGAFLARVCNEVLASVLGVASVGIIAGRYAVGVVLPVRAR